MNINQIKHSDSSVSSFYAEGVEGFRLRLKISVIKFARNSKDYSSPRCSARELSINAAK